jgi:hypothetical protein
MRLQGHYRVSLNGFRCNTATWDTAFALPPEEGFGDEVFFQIEYRIVDSAGELLEPPTRRQTKTIGAAGGGRHQFGSATDITGLIRFGGIASGDEFPGTHPEMRREPFPDPNADDVPPLLIWAGDLVSDWQGDRTDYWIGRQVKHEKVVFITPTICERDPGEAALDGWITWQVGADAKFGAKAKQIVGGIWPLAAPVFDAVSLGIQTAGTLDQVRGKAGTRPIGTQRDPATGELFFTPQVLDLSQARAEQIISEDLGYGLGVRQFHAQDSDEFHGDYVFWLQVERLGPLRELPPI